MHRVTRKQLSSFTKLLHKLAGLFRANKTFGVLSSAHPARTSQAMSRVAREQFGSFATPITFDHVKGPPTDNSLPFLGGVRV